MKRRRWDETPVSASAGSSSGSRWDQTPIASSSQTPLVGKGSAGMKRGRWDETPVAAASVKAGGSRWDMTPVNTIQATPQASLDVKVTPEVSKQLRWERELAMRNAPLSDEMLDSVLPSKGFVIVEQPKSYQPPVSKLLATPTPYRGTAGGFSMEAGVTVAGMGAVGFDGSITETTTAPDGSELPFIKDEDMQYFGKLMEQTDIETISPEEAKERKIMRLLLRIKNGTPPQRKSSLRQITDKARDFGPGALFNQILPLLMSPTLEDQERHLLVKVIDRILYKLDDLVRPYVHKILVVIEPMLIDEDYYARVEGREIISNLAKAAGLATMIATMRPDIDNVDDYVRNSS